MERQVRVSDQAGAHWIEVSVGYGRGNGQFVQQQAAVKAALPEAAGAVVFPIGTTGDWLVDVAHEPGEVAQSLA